MRFLPLRRGRLTCENGRFGPAFAGCRCVCATIFIPLYDKKLAMAENEKELLDDLGGQEYKYGFTTQIETETIRKGLDEQVVRLISAKKGEPE